MLTQWISDFRHGWRALRPHAGFLVTSVVHPRARHRRGRRDVQRRQHRPAQAAAVPRPRPPRRRCPARRRAPTCRSVSASARSSTSTTRSARSSSTASSSSAAAPRRCARTNRVERIPMALPTNDIYATLGVRPQLGRLPVAEDDDGVVADQRPALEHLVRPRSRGDRQVVLRLGRDARRSSASCRRSSASRATTRCSGWPSEIRPTEVRPGQLGAPVIARMKPGVTREQLAAELTRLSKELPARFGGPPNYARIIEQHSALVEPMLDRLVGPTASTSLWVLLGAVSVVLLIACANVANLFLVRAEGAPPRAGRAPRDRRVARAARPAPDDGGVPRRAAGGRARRRPQRRDAAALPARRAGGHSRGSARCGSTCPTLAAAFGLVLVAALACGVVPALRASSPDLDRLRDGRRGSTGRRHWGRDAARGRADGARAGAAHRLGAAGAELPAAAQRRSRLRHRGHLHLPVRAASSRTPHRRAGLGTAAPRLHGPAARAARRDGRRRRQQHPARRRHRRRPRFITEAMDPEGGGALLDQNFTGGDYFRVMGIDLLRGRPFTNDEAVTPNSNVIISRSAAERLWPGEIPLGQRIRRTGEHAAVVHRRRRGRGREAGRLAGGRRGGRLLPADRTDADGVGDGIAGLRRQVAARRQPAAARCASWCARSRPRRRCTASSRWSSWRERSMVQLSFTMLTLGVVSALALILGAVGLYGVLSYVVSPSGRGRSACAWRSAPPPARCGGMVVSQGAKVVLVGVVIGVARGAWRRRACWRRCSSTSTRWSPLVFVAMSLMMIAIGMLASYVPARRASTRGSDRVAAERLG